MDNSLQKQMDEIIRQLLTFKASVRILNTEKQVNFITRPDIQVETAEALIKEISDSWFQRI